MTDTHTLTRRSLIGALPFAALAVPALTAAHAAENPHDKVLRLQRELSDALAELAGFSPAFDYISVVRPAGSTPHTRVLIDRSVYDAEEQPKSAEPEHPEVRIQHHFRELARAMNERSPGLWRGMIDHRLDVVALHRDLGDTSGRQGLQIDFDVRGHK